MLSNEVQPENVDSPMLLTPFGMTMLVSELQSVNAAYPIFVMLSGIVMLSSKVHLANAYSRMDATGRLL